MVTLSDLKKMTIQQLTPLAKKYGITRLHSMRKCELMERLLFKMNEKEDFLEETSLKDCKKDLKKSLMESFSTVSSTPKEESIPEKWRLESTAPIPVPTNPSQALSRPVIPSKQSQLLNLAYLPDAREDIQDESLSVKIIDPYWLHVTWCIRRRSLERARAAMGQLWYEARPILRVTILSDGDAGTGARYRHERDILIHGLVNHWFVAVKNPPATYQIEIGYLAKQRFFSLLKGNVVSTPQVRSALRYEESTDVSWMHACGLQPAQTPPWSPSNHHLSKKWVSRTNSLFTVESTEKEDDDKNTKNTSVEYPFRIETEMVIYGSTSPDSRVTVDQEWVAVQPDGTFMLRIDIPEQGKQVMTVDSINRQESRKMILSLERTTNILKPQKLDTGKKKKKTSKKDAE